MQQLDPSFCHHDWILIAVNEEHWFMFPRKPSSMLTAEHLSILTSLMHCFGRCWTFAVSHQALKLMTGVNRACLERRWSLAYSNWENDICQAAA
jgi:hypothetical protein